METLAWTLQILLAALFLTASSKWVIDRVSGRRAALPELSDRQIAALSFAETSGAVGLILPTALDIAPVLTPVAATCLFLLMVAAARRNLIHEERGQIAANAVIGLMAISIAILRFGPLAP